MHRFDFKICLTFKRSNNNKKNKKKQKSEYTDYYMGPNDAFALRLMVNHLKKKKNNSEIFRTRPKWYHVTVSTFVNMYTKLLNNNNLQWKLTRENTHYGGIKFLRIQRIIIN